MKNLFNMIVSVLFAAFLGLSISSFSNNSFLNHPTNGHQDTNKGIGEGARQCLHIDNMKFDGIWESDKSLHSSVIGLLINTDGIGEGS